jgi:hypothetical protein
MLVRLDLSLVLSTAGAVLQASIFDDKEVKPLGTLGALITLEEGELKEEGIGITLFQDTVSTSSKREGTIGGCLLLLFTTPQVGSLRERALVAEANQGSADE